MKTERKQKWLAVLLAWLPFVLVLNQIASLFGINTRLYFLLAGLGGVFPFVCQSGNGNKPVFKHMMGFAVYGIFSVVLCALNEVDLKAWLVDVLVFVLPMGYFAAGSCEFNTGTHYEKGFWLALSISFLLGFYLYFFAPSWYAHRLAAIWSGRWYRDTISEFAVLQYSRFSGIFGGSYAISYFGIAALSMSFCSFVHPSSPREKKLAGLALVACWVACILCQQRIAMVCSTLIVIGHVGYGAQKTGNMRQLVAIAVAAVLFSGVAYWVATMTSERVARVGEQLFRRWEAMDFGQAMESRTWQYRTLMANWNAVVLGHGLGSGGAYARSHGLPGVTDGQYVKVLYEQGLLGVTWLGVIFICTLVRGLKHFRLFRFELGTIVFFCLAGIASNALCMNALYSMPFWYSLGRIWNYAELNVRKTVWTLK